MKNNFLKMGICTLAGVLIGGVTIVGANQAIQAIQNDQIIVRLNGIDQIFKDEKTGERQYPITYHDRTYLPLRNIAQLSGLSVDYDATTKTAILNEGFSSYLEAYEGIINKDIKEYGKEYINYELIYFNNDDIPDLLYGLPGYWSGIAIYKNGQLHFPLGELGLGYGVAGRAGFQIFEKCGTIVDYDSDYAGAVAGVTYITLNDDFSMNSLYSRQLGALDNIDLNNASEEEKEFYKEAIEDVEKYGGYFDFDSKKISKEEFEKILKEKVPMTGKSLSCEPTKKASEVLEELFTKYDDGLRNEKIKEFIKLAYNGQEVVNVDGKKENVYDYVYDFNHDHINDLLKVNSDKDITVYCLDDNGNNMTAKLRKDAEINGNIKAIYINKDISDFAIDLYSSVYLRIDEENEVLKSEGYYKLSMDVNGSLYFDDFFLKEIYLDKDTKKVVGTGYYKKSYSESGVSEMKEEDYNWQVNRITKSDENKEVIIVHNKLAK